MRSKFYRRMLARIKRCERIGVKRDLIVAFDIKRLIEDGKAYAASAGIVLICAAAGVLAARMACAELLGDGIGVSLTSTSTTVTFDRSLSSVTFINGPTAAGVASANEAYVRLFHCSETAAAATTAAPIRLQPGESVTITRDADARERGFCAFSAVTAATETATLRWLGQ